jgi:3-hydroxyacyl-CoA dehydrogenase/3-hydroxy-2-methylbutyryl-CoA dehydrogenase
MKLQGKTALITGGASGLGRGAAEMVVEQGGRVALLDRAGSAGAEVAEALGDAAVFLPTDVTEPAEVAAAFDRVQRELGGVHLTLNAAGVADAARVLSRSGEMFPLDLYEKVVRINLLGLFDIVRHSARLMSANEPDGDGARGVIVNVASIAGIEGQAGQAAYAASKGGVIAMTLPLARDLASIGIRVATICPGIFDTGMLAGTDDKIKQRLIDIHVFPKRLGTPADFAHLVRSIMENPMLNGEVIRLDAATRLSHG